MSKYKMFYLFKGPEYWYVLTDTDKLEILNFDKMSRRSGNLFVYQPCNKITDPVFKFLATNSIELITAAKQFKCRSYLAQHIHNNLDEMSSWSKSGKDF